MRPTEEKEVFSRLEALRERFEKLSKSADPGEIERARLTVQILRRYVSGLEYGGVLSLRKIIIEPPTDAALLEDWRALLATLAQKGLRCA